jgi:hypothetical protein
MTMKGKAKLIAIATPAPKRAIRESAPERVSFMQSHKASMPTANRIHSIVEIYVLGTLAAKGGNPQDIQEREP